MDKKRLSEILSSLGEERENYYGAVAPPIIQTSNFAFSSTDQMRDYLNREFDEHLYTRGNNPTVKILREKLSALEGMEDALVFSSGSAAVTAAIMSQVKAGDHVICVEKPYTWTFRLLNDLLVKYGVETTFVDGTDPGNFSSAIKENTRLIYLESPNSFTFSIQDIKSVCAIAKKHGISTIIDNSYSSPLYQNPGEMGVDIIVHSASKYLTGHSDVVAGVLCSSRETVKKIFSSEFMTMGSKIGPFEAWLIIRGLRTLEIRMERVSETAEEITTWLSARKEISKVFYPFHPDFEQLELARKQMKRSGGLFTIELNVESVEQVEVFCDSLKHFSLGVSWGGHESLVFPACAAGIRNDQYDLRAKYVRVYCGLENVELLKDDLEAALLATHTK